MPAPPRCSRGTSARGPVPSRDRPPCRWQRTPATDAPGAIRTRWRRLRIGSSTTPVVPDSACSSAAGASVSRPRPTKRARSVSHSTGPCGRPSRLSTCMAHTAGVARVAWAPVAQQSRALAEVFGFEKQLRERWMGEIVNCGCQDHFHVAGHIDFPDPGAVVGHCRPPHLDVVLSRHDDLEARREIAVPAVERGFFGTELDRGTRPVLARSDCGWPTTLRCCERRADR